MIHLQTTLDKLKAPDLAVSHTHFCLHSVFLSFIRSSHIGLFTYPTEAYSQCDCCWKAFPPSPEGLFRPGAAVVMGLGEAWSVSTSGAKQDRAPATHQPQCYCPASQRPTPGARQWRRCSKLSQEWSRFTKIVHLAPQPPHLLHLYQLLQPPSQRIWKGKYRQNRARRDVFLAPSLSSPAPLFTLLNLNSPFFW